MFSNYSKLIFLIIIFKTGEKSNPEIFAENVREKMSICLNTPLSDYSYEDAIFMNKIKKCKLPYEIGLIRVQYLKKKFK